MKSYYSSIKQYSWIVLVCALLASVIGFFITRAQPAPFQASAALVVEAGTPGAGATFVNSYVDPNRSLTEANNYVTQIQSHAVINFVYNLDPEIGKRGYTPSYLLSHVTATASTVSATIVVTASSARAEDSVLLANDVATGFTTYIQQQTQQRLNALRDNLQHQIDKYQKLNSDLEKQILTMGANNTADPRYGVYTSDREENNRTIDTLQSQLLLLPATVTGDVSVAQKAENGDATTSGKGASIIATTGGVGILVGILVIFLLIFLDNQLRSDKQVKEKLGLAYLGSISPSQELEMHPTQYTNSTIKELTDICAGLPLTGILAREWRAPQGTALLVTSAQVAEGKTTVATALATVAARSGSSVLVVDANLERPSTHLAFGMSEVGFGLGDLLKGTPEAQINAAVLQTPLTSVWLLPAGQAMEGAALLLEQKFPHVLEHLRNKVDLVIIDGPAILNGVDASVVASMVDGIALVVDARHSKLSVLLRAKEVLHSLTHTPIGVIMNHLSPQPQNRYYASAYSKKSVVTLKDDTLQKLPAISHRTKNKAVSKPISLTDMPNLPITDPTDTISSPR